MGVSTVVLMSHCFVVQLVQMLSAAYTPPVDSP